MFTKRTLLESRNACCQLAEAVTGLSYDLRWGLMLHERKKTWEKFWDSVLHNCGVFWKPFKRCNNVLSEDVRDFIRRAKYRQRGELPKIEMYWPVHGLHYVTTYHELAWMCGRAANSVFDIYDGVPVEMEKEPAETICKDFEQIATAIVADVEACILEEYEFATAQFDEETKGKNFTSITKGELMGIIGIGATKLRQWIDQNSTNILEDSRTAKTVEVENDLLSRIRDLANPA